MFNKALTCFLKDSNGRLTASSLTVRRGAGKRIIGRFSSVPNRNKAETIIGHKICVERESLPDLEADEYYVSDLIGLNVSTLQGQVLGAVVQVHETLRGDILEFHLGETVQFIPLLEAYVGEVDVQNGTIALTPEGVANL
jgi:16S rRNA processing protein RimM